jgi:amino acid transporter
LSGESAALPATPATADRSLKHNALGLNGAMILGVVIMAPALAIYTNWGFMIPSVGRATSFVFIISMVIALPTAYSYAVLSTRMPSSGSAYKWAAHLTKPWIGIFIGLCATLYYAAIIPYDMPAIALLGSDLVRSTNTAVFAIILFGSLLLALPIILRGIAVSIKASMILVTLEVVIVTVVAVVCFFKATGSQVSAAPFNPSHIPSVSALVPALVLGVLSFTGFDAISTLSEETREPKKLIPRATILAILVTGLFWVIISAILSNALPPRTYTKVIANGGFPLGAAAEKAFGSFGRDIIDIMGIEAGFVLLIAAVVGSTRIIFAMGRDGVMDRRLGVVHHRYRVPWFAIGVVLVCSVVAVILVSFFQGWNYNIALWLSNFITFFALVTYLGVNVCNPLFFLRYAPEEFNWLRNAVIPAFAIVITLYFFYKGFFQGLWANTASFKNGHLIIFVGVALLVVAAVASVLMARRPGSAEAAAAYVDESESFDAVVPPSVRDA